MALAAVALNAAANDVAIETTPDDLLERPPAAADVLLVGDLFYERALADRVLACIEAAAAKVCRRSSATRKRNYFPTDRFAALAEYQVPVTRDLEDAEIKRTAVWRYAG